MSRSSNNLKKQNNKNKKSNIQANYSSKHINKYQDGYGNTLSDT